MKSGFSKVVAICVVDGAKRLMNLLKGHQSQYGLDIHQKNLVVRTEKLRTFRLSKSILSAR